MYITLEDVNRCLYKIFIFSSYPSPPRLYVISRFPQLVMLDSSVVEDEEKRASKDIYGDILPPVKKDRDELGQEPRDRRRKKKKGGEPRRRKEKMGGPSSSSSSLAKKEVRIVELLLLLCL